ncbi:CinA family protein [Psychromonas sp. 14N.309.X.WAT.B.A12]|jgi:nicotinamide-nucleotide amidase|uniref:CinA family protein n=1 Tax=unclassified Psychromonas TaxID=2614957 RepID=UPI0025AF6AAE|nr:nicotinamide-nucleotide amidohydrolase family protein [Psychromonas sp. 14N.309.X.WAT.B.A12]MDN2663306.1 nicotinamide-nucleotide amidohydrolase family protein [Psychromonas sp. 14N.309.X.WAT.B.A12]
MLTEKTVQELAQVLGEKLTNAGLVATTAESCTGGGVAYAITEISGSSLWFDRSFITYSNGAKTQMLGVDPDLINEFGAVSKEVVNAMAIGAVKNSDADIAVAISGIAGPDGGSEEKPVGTVCIAWYNAHSGHKTESYLFVGDRSAVRTQAIRLALLGLIENADALGSV